MNESTEHHISVTKTARYWTLGCEDAPEIWVVLHGYKQLARRFLKRFSSVGGDGVLVVAPEALSRFYVSPEPGRHGSSSVVGATWMTREDRLNEIRDYVGYLDVLAERLGAGDRKLTVLGFSQGVATATRWVVHGAVEPDRLILWGDFTPPDLDLTIAARALANVEILLVRGDDDPSLDPKLGAEEAARLRGADIGHHTLTYHGGHEIDPGTLGTLVEG